jgi:actin related protein 2/3 complex subunit 3
MPYHSKFDKAPGENIGGTVFLPLKTESKGPAPSARPNEEDIIDEALDYFRANVMFRAFEVESPADRVLCYLTVYIGELIRAAKPCATREEAKKALYTYSRKGFKVPGEPGFSLGGFMTAPANRNDVDKLRGFLKQLREETAERIIKRLYNDDGTQNKHWFQFHKRKFMNIDQA